MCLPCQGPSTTTETETVAKYEIMDGAPVKGESIPIRLFLAGYSSSLFSKWSGNFKVLLTTVRKYWVMVDGIVCLLQDMI